jgi:hypothetical protein
MRVGVLGYNHTVLGRTRPVGWSLYNQLIKGVVMVNFIVRGCAAQHIQVS